MLSEVWHGMHSNFAGLKVGWRGVEQLPHQFDYKQKEDLPQLDVCIVYRNAEGASNSDVIFRACREGIVYLLSS